MTSTTDANLEKYFKYIDDNTAFLIDQLHEAVAIPSISATAKHRSEVIRMGEWIKTRLEGLGARVQMVHPGPQELQGQTVQLPPVVLGEYGTDPAKKTITIYGHYDVQPALKSDGWDTDPFTLVETEDGRLVGRGSTDDKGPVIGWILCLEAHQKLGIHIPVNLKFCFEGMEESGSIGLDAIIRDQADKWFKGTDYTCICDNFWLGTTKSGLTYGLRGNNYFFVEVSGPAADLHSGVFGGTVQEPLVALTRLMSTLVDIDGKILIPGIYDQVAETTQEENKTYEGFKCTLKVSADRAGRWWYSSPDHPNYIAASKAVKRVYGTEPERIREGGSIPITITFEEALKKNVVLLSMGRANDGAHSTNEKLDKYNYIEGIKQFGAYWAEIANL
ncbi:hypothetical protein BB558_002319 [Smittium angustum]|uniref:Peptidase M20 dimerisation domain-containing protein n=1 Tax=Smittium angustum TaxID=133377 RepID=A0A2U1J985_SMIAN|nr:hypothetical protein BB558_002319 [Smittium angustum]